MGLWSELAQSRWVTLYAPALVAPIVIGGTIYAAVQQDYRSNANDPQIQISQDISGQLNSGQTQVSQLVPSGSPKTDLKTSLDNFLIVYDQSGKLVASSAQIDSGGTAPLLPAGVFTATTASGQDIFTWQPASGVRLATVVVPFTSGGQKGFVAVGRSLKLVEQREQNLEWLCAAAWAVLELLVVLALVHLEMRSRPVVEVAEGGEPEEGDQDVGAASGDEESPS